MLLRRIEPAALADPAALAAALSGDDAAALVDCGSRGPVLAVLPAALLLELVAGRPDFAHRFRPPYESHWTA